MAFVIHLDNITKSQKCINIILHSDKVFKGDDKRLLDKLINGVYHHFNKCTL